MLLSVSGGDNGSEAFYYIVIIALILFAMFIVRVIIHQATNSNNFKPFAITMLIACVFSAVPFVLAIIIKAMAMDEDFSIFSAMILLAIMFGCEFIVTFIFTSGVGTITEYYHITEYYDAGRKTKEYDTEVKSNGFFASLLTSLIVSLLIVGATVLCIDYSGTVWYSFLVTIIPAAIIFIPMLILSIICIKILRRL